MSLETMLVKDLLRLALIPRGGSVVIFRPLWSTEVGKSRVGIEVRMSLKSEWTCSEKSIVS